MANINTITSLHVQKLGHKIEEIRCRALENIISKLEHGFTCNCEGVKRELLSKLFNWFSFETFPNPGKVLDLIHYLISQNKVIPFEDPRTRADLHQLRVRLSPSWHQKLDQIEESLAHLLPPSNSPSPPQRRPPSPQTSTLLDATLPSPLNTPVSKRTENSIRWLVMPWQPLVSSDRGVLSAVEEALTNKTDPSLITHTCQLITNVMLQDFPAEVFLQRPSIISIFQNFLKTSDDPKVIRTILKVLHKLTRSLRFRIYYYCDPCIANKRQRVLKDQSISSSGHSSQEDLDIDESVLQLQQVLLPNYCIETLTNSLRLVNSQVEGRPLETIKSMMDVSSELVDLLKMCLMPSIWLCADGLSLKIHEDLKTLMKLLGDVLEFLRSYSTIDHWRITYLQLLSITMKLLSSLVPLEVSDYVLPGGLKMSLAVALMDAPIYLIHPGLHSTLQEYARQFRGVDEIECLRMFEETRAITRSLKAAVSLLRSREDEDIVTKMYLSKASLEYHKCYSIIMTYFSILQSFNDFSLEDKSLSSRLLLHLMSHRNEEIRLKTYEECSCLVSATLGVEKTRGRFTWTCVLFLFDKNILTEIICHGVNDVERIKTLAEDILIFLVKGKVQMGESGWGTFLEALHPVFPLLQSLAETRSPLGQCISKMLDPDMYKEIGLTYLEVLKGNIRLLFASDGAIREESVFRLIYLLGMEKDSSSKRPRLSSLHGLPLSSLLILERQCSFKKPEGTYERSNLSSVLEMLRMPNVEPKVRKSALIQVSVMLTDTSLHKIFMKEKGLETILEIFERSLLEKDFENYPDSVVPIVSILKLISSTQLSVRHQLSNDTNVFTNILRSLFLFPNHEAIKLDTSPLLFLLLFHDQMMNIDVMISLPEVIVTRMRVPFVCKTHWKTSIHRNGKDSLVCASNPLALTFLRQFWAWEWNNREDILWSLWENVNNSEVDDDLKIRQQELSTLQYSSIRFYTQQQLFNIKNSTTHEEVTCALDYLWMYIKLSDLNGFEKNLISFTSMPWEQSFERFLLSHPTSKEDCCLFVEVLNFLNILITITKDPGVILWISTTTRHMTKSISDLLRSLDKNYQNVHQSLLKLVRTCINLERQEGLEETENSLEDFIEIIVSNLCSNDQQHFYNLAYLDWLLNCLTYLTSDSKWKKMQSNKNLVTTLGNFLMELIVSFHGNGAVSFMGLSITKNSIICLNHLLDHMETKISFWYDNGRTINWLPTLWTNRDPLVRASALQLLTGLVRVPHNGQDLLHGLGMAPNELCQTLIKVVINREESCIVREKAAMALGHLVKNSKCSSFNYCDSLRSNAIIIYVEQANVYYEISLLCSNLYLSATLDPPEESSDPENSETSRSTAPRSVLHYYNCHDELLMLSVKDSINDLPEFVTTPSLVTAVCSLLNHLIVVGEGEVVSKIYESSLEKYLVSCFGAIPKGMRSPQLCEVLQMFTSICTVLTNCISHCGEFAGSVSFSPDFLYLLMSYLKRNCESRGMGMRKRLWTEVFNLISVLSLTEGQHVEAIKTAVELVGAETIVFAICLGVEDGDGELRMSAIACLGFLLGQGIEGTDLIGDALDGMIVGGDGMEDKLQHVLVGVKESNLDRRTRDGRETAGARICGALMHLMIAHNYANSKKKNRMSRDKDLIMGTLANLLCMSDEAKACAVQDKLGQTCLMILKELYTEINLQPHQPQKSNSEREKKLGPVLSDVTKVLVLLMNFACGSAEVKRSLAAAGVADMVHKLWAWIYLSDCAVIAALKMIATLTTECPEAAQSMTLTTTLPGTGPRRTPNTVSLLNVIIHLISREIDRASQSFDNHRLHFAFHVLRNSVHVHECRVAISKSNLLQFFTKIHPLTTKRNKPWPLIEIYCLEFLIDFTFYEEGQICVPKSTDAFEVLIQLSKCPSSTQRILSLSILRNLVFNVSNRPRILSSIEFMNLLHGILKNGSFSEIAVAGSILWSLVANNQKAKLIARTAGFAQSLQEVLGRLSLDKMPDENQHRDLAKMIQYVIKLIKATDTKSDLHD
ncbi:rotatin [Diachasma alloeum]|uniref:rotatin n=1 Tax=Diachasma alloeum TaxID=454923 RepID=UPI00073821B8|nr:rotatin [Diachasma alloeum]